MSANTLSSILFTLQHEIKTTISNQNINMLDMDDTTHTFSLSETRLNQFKTDLDQVGSSATSPYLISPIDYQAVFPALACGENPSLPRLPQRARCILLRRLRNLVEDHHLDGNRTTPGAYFDFPETRTGVIQLASIPGRVWSSFQSYTFVMWIWFPRKISKGIERKRSDTGLETTQPQDALLFSLSTPTAIGIEGRMREEPSSASRSITLGKYCFICLFLFLSLNTD